MANLQKLVGSNLMFKNGIEFLSLIKDAIQYM